MLSLLWPGNIVVILVLMFATYLITRKSISGESYTEIVKASFLFLLGWVQAVIAYFSKKGDKTE